MWIARGTLLGVWLFSFGTIVFFYFSFFPKVVGRTSVDIRTLGTISIDIRTLSAITIANPTFWLWLAACVSLGLIAGRSWRGHAALWITLAVTEIIPVGLLAMVLVLVSRVRALAK